MKKIINRSQYAEELGFIPYKLEPMMKKVRRELKAEIPKGWVTLRMEEVPIDRGRTIIVVTTLTIVRAPRIVTRRNKSTKNLVQ